MVLKYIMNFFSEVLVQHASHSSSFRKLARFLNTHFSPKKDIFVNVHGYKMYANTLDRITALYLWKFSALESLETKLIRKLVKKNMVIFDIGANIGYYTLIFADMVGGNGKVYAFEPDPSNYRLLLKNLKANGCDNVITIKKAISDKVGEINFFFSEEHRGDHRIYDPGDGRKLLRVKTTVLDEFVRDKIQPDIIKIDIEGGEFLAFLGMDKTIKSNKGLIIVCEFWPSALKKCGASPQKFLNKIEDYGFKIKLINESKDSIEQVDTSSLMNICRGNKSVNLLLKR